MCSGRWLKLLKLELISRNSDADDRKYEYISYFIHIKHITYWPWDFEGSIEIIDKNFLKQGMEDELKKFNYMCFLWL